MKLRSATAAHCAACALLALSAGGCLLAAQHGTKAPAVDPRHGSSDSFVELGNAWIRVRDLGPAAESKRRPLLLVHGYGSRLESWDRVQPELARRRRVVSYDQRGFGMSERTAGEYGPAAHAQDLAAIADKLGLHKPILVGHSYGAGVVLRAALDAPERFSGLVLIDAFALDEQLPPAFRWAKVPGLGEFIFATQFKEVVGEKYILAFHDKQRFSTPEAIDEYRGNMTKPGAVYAALRVVRGMEYRADEPRYSSLRMPILILWGEDDRVTPLSAGKALTAKIDAADLKVLSECGHVPLWERPRAVMMHIEEHAARIEGARRR